jgi:hypothetical protein
VAGLATAPAAAAASSRALSTGSATPGGADTLRVATVQQAAQGGVLITLDGQLNSASELARVRAWRAACWRVQPRAPARACSG